MKIIISGWLYSLIVRDLPLMKSPNSQSLSLLSLSRCEHTENTGDLQLREQTNIKFDRCEHTENVRDKKNHYNPISETEGNKEEINKKDMTGKKFKELVTRIPDDAEVVHLWNGGFAWRQGGGMFHVFSFKPDFLQDNE